MTAAAPLAAPTSPAPPDAVSVRIESATDHAETAALAAEAFAAEAGRFTPEGLRWLYRDAYGEGATVLAAYAGPRKVGHLALLHQTVTVDGRPEPAVALVDVFVLEAFRSLATLVGLYRAAEAACRERGVRLILSVPNAMAADVNARILRLAEAARLDVRVGVGGLPVPGVPVVSHRVADLGAERGRRILAPFCGGTQTGLGWTAERLWGRLGRPGAGYALHVGERLLAVSARRRARGAPHALICALLPRHGTTVGRRDVAAVTSAACRLQRRPLFAYAGINDAVPLPGLLLPGRLRPSPMVLQMRDLRRDAAPFRMQRFEAIDFDLA
ncbi:GNAT family N-acetyltransferase [Lichenibacterium minor]|uniref:GNAT family N-acetyltransferase n=1 Tax=Lichenibacterium minor TaxID=2316528 RepID=A0A4Q2U8M0_9HYPH|nr:GNAT family N-acetyltransferase [Lichenibacterium minor]RYC32782.1 GNAT family N-acetyltransferase [Lichenibacterium minor]